jgi:hypothetical protein
VNKAAKMQEKTFGLNLLYFVKTLGKNPEEIALR